MQTHEDTIHHINVTYQKGTETFLACNLRLFVNYVLFPAILKHLQPLACLCPSRR